MSTFIDDSAIFRVEELAKKYKETWGHEVDYTAAPKGLTQEKLAECLKLMIKENVSLLVGYNRLFIDK